ncbi:MAG TPA: hypothetical protein VGV10_07370 [Thermoleophilaceae bacterium]|nr:hypothetical protein [Thermoleophilaceae bacterium]
MRRHAASALTACLLAAAGCGNDRVSSGSLFDVPKGKATRTLSYPQAGLKVTVPKEFDVKASTPPQLFRASLNAAFISSFAYRREEQLPKTREDLVAARRRLVDAAKKRDKTFRLKSDRLTKVDGAPAIELLGDQTIFKGRLRLRSLHVYRGNGEYVVELVAPVAAFARLDRASFPTIRRSLEVTGKVKKPKKAAKKPKPKKKTGSEEPAPRKED